MATKTKDLRIWVQNNRLVWGLIVVVVFSYCALYKPSSGGNGLVPSTFKNPFRLLYFCYSGSLFFQSG